MKQRNIRMIETNGIRLKVIVEGSGPLVLLLHGFPQCGYLWRNQIDDLVAAGYQVAVPDQRGYGGSDKPADPQAYDSLTLSADAVGIADALGHETFTLVTHDWGAIIGWYMASLYPQRVNAVFALSVPPTIGTPVGALTRQENFGDNFVYTVYFQQPGVAEAELDADVRKSIRKLYYSVSGDAPEFGFMRPKPASSKMLDGLVDPDPLPSWLTEEDLDRYVEDYRDGFRGPINWYRSIDRGIELTRHLLGSQDHAAVPLHDRKSGSHERASLGCPCQRGAERTQSARQRRTRWCRPLASHRAAKGSQCRVARLPRRARAALRSPP